MLKKMHPPHQGAADISSQKLNSVHLEIKKRLLFNITVKLFKTHILKHNIRFELRYRNL